MARIKKLPNESETQYNTRVQIEHISNIATRNERISWDRKMDNMVKLLAKIRPIEDQISNLILQKQDYFDEVTRLRTEMVKNCIHPATQLTHHVDEVMGEYVACKFCDRKFVGINVNPDK